MFKLLLIFFVTANAWGYQYYYYSSEKVKVSKPSFRRYVRSQARSIVGEFYGILGKLDPLQNDLTRIRREILKQSTQWKSWKAKCFLHSLKCEQRLHNFYSRARELDRKILRFQKGNLKRWQDIAPNSHEEVDALISVSETLDKISTLNYQSLHLIEEILITSGGDDRSNFFSEDNFAPLLRLMMLSADHLLMGLISPLHIKTQFSNIWVNFIKRLEQHVVIGNNQDYLLDHLAEFNISWNSFHMNLKKDRYVEKPVLSSSVLKTVGMMHNRWNWILKLYLKNTNLIGQSAPAVKSKRHIGKKKKKGPR